MYVYMRLLTWWHRNQRSFNLLGSPECPRTHHPRFRLGLPLGDTEQRPGAAKPPCSPTASDGGADFQAPAELE